MQLDIQLLASDSVEALLDLSAELYAFDGTTAFHRAPMGAAITQLLDHPHLGRAALLVADGERVGYIVLGFGFSLEFGGRDAFLDELYVREPFRGQGIGSAAMKWFEAVCRSESIQALHLEVEFSNSPAQEFYRKTGFQDHNRFLWTKRLSNLSSTPEK